MLTDPRVVKQAKLLVNYCTKIKPGDVVAISATDLAKPLIVQTYREILKQKPKEVVTHIGFDELAEVFYDVCSEEQLRQFPQLAMDEVKNVDVWIGIIAPKNTRHLTKVHPKKLSVRSKVLKPLLDYRVAHTRWVLTAFPTEAQAQEADMSAHQFSDFLFSTMVDVDWAALSKKQNQLAKRLETGSTIRIVGENTDLTCSIQGRKVIADNGEMNMPGGEVFTSVVENSASGTIHFTYPAIYGGREVAGVQLWFEKGKVVKAKASKGESFLSHMLDMDAGARFIGELGLGNNFKIDRFVKHILFDEKIGGTIHVALGRSYEETLGKNESALHWDMIKDLRTGGMLYLDDKLIQKNGKWLI